MSLLLRRRALIEACADAVEGGGENDGKYVWLQCKYGNNSYYKYLSTDFGQTYTLQNNTSRDRSSYSHSINVDYLGSVYFTSDSKAKRTDIGDSYTTTYLGLIRSGSGAGSTSNVGIPYVRSINVNRDASKALLLRSTNYTAQPLTHLQVLTFENHSRTGSLELTSSISGLWTTAIYGDGPFVEANRETLQYVIAGPVGTQRRGTSGNSGSISYDYGQTWTKIEDVIFGSQSSSPNSMRGAAWTDKGDKCLVCYGSWTDSHLYLSKDYGHTFTQLTDPQGLENNVHGVFTSEKFKTIYVTGLSSSIGVIYRSQDLGRTWTKVKSFDGESSTVGVPMDCNAKGDKLVASLHRSTGGTSYLSYSLDYGETWGCSNLAFNSWDGAGLGRTPCMSRDYTTNYSSSGGGGDSGYSMSRAEMISEVSSWLTQVGGISKWGYLELSTDGETLDTEYRWQSNPADSTYQLYVSLYSDNDSSDLGYMFCQGTGTSLIRRTTYYDSVDSISVLNDLSTQTLESAISMLAEAFVDNMMDNHNVGYIHNVITS